LKSGILGPFEAIRDQEAGGNVGDFGNRDSRDTIVFARGRRVRDARRRLPASRLARASPADDSRSVMENQIESVVQTASGSRNVREGRYRGVKIIVVAGFDIWTDDWPFHVYVQHDDEARSRLSGMPTQWRSASLEGAFEEGMRLAVRHLSPALPGVRAADEAAAPRAKGKVAAARRSGPAPTEAGGGARPSSSRTGAKAAMPKTAPDRAAAGSRGASAPAPAKAWRKAGAGLDGAAGIDGNGLSTIRAKARPAAKPAARVLAGAKAKHAARAR
jgi:hypothetical protein